MIQLGAKLENICVAVGPCIQKKNYEVGIEFYKDLLIKILHSKTFSLLIKIKKYFLIYLVQ